jgi:hypothetical protein
MRRIRFLAALLLALAPAAPSWAALARVELVPSAPSAASAAPLSVAALAPALPATSNSSLAAILTALAPMLAPNAAAPAPEAFPLPNAARATQASPARAASPEFQIERGPDGRKRAVLTLKAAAAPDAPPEVAGRLFDAAPAAPDYDALSPVRAPQAPVAWSPPSLLLKPIAAAVNAWRDSRHEKRLANLGPGERVTSEEWSLRDSLSGIHAAITEGRFQDALQTVADHFQTRRAAVWYMENPLYASYRSQAFSYLRFTERAIKIGYERADLRGRDERLVAEAISASRAGKVRGHAWRETAIQEKDSSHCAQNAFYNAVAASVGFARPTSVSDFVAASRAALNRAAKIEPGVTDASAAALTKELGINFGRRDVGEGMSEDSIAEWASILGMKLAARGPPQGAAGWSALLGPGREILLSLRMFHGRFVHDYAEREMRGHDYRVLHHEVYLLGAFDSPSRGERLFMVQDSGSGATLIATAEELTAMTQRVEVLQTAGPVRLP